MASQVTSLMNTINPYKLWQTNVYNNISGYNVHAYECFDCIGYLHYANRYDILIAALDTDSVVYEAAVNSPVLFTESNSGDDAVNIVNYLYSLYCYAGVHVVERYVDEWTDSYFDNRYSFTVGTKKTIVAWGVQGVYDCTT
jgi:hypothetical protein